MTAGKSPQLGRQFAWASTARVIAAILQAILLIVAARAVSSAEFGLLASVLGVATVVQTALDMGVSTFVTRERAASPDSGSVATALRFNALTSVIMALLAGTLILWAGTFNVSFLFLLPLAIWVSAERTADLRLAIAFADGDVRVNSLNLLARRLTSIVLLVALLYLAVEPLLAYSIAVALAAVASAIFANAYVRKRVVTRSDISFRKLIRMSWPYWLHSVATQARNLDSAIVALVAGSTQAGYFSVASRLTSPLRILPTSLESVLLPNAARAGTSGMRPLARLAAIATLICVGVYAVVFAATPWALPVLLGDAYAGSVPAVMIVVAGLPFAAAGSLHSSLLLGAGHKHFVATVSVCSSLLCLLAVAAFGFVWGAIGAAGALSGTFAVQALAILTGYYILVHIRSTRNGDAL